MKERRRSEKKLCDAFSTPLLLDLFSSLLSTSSSLTSTPQPIKQKTHSHRSPTRPTFKRFVVTDRGVSFDEALSMLRTQPLAPPAARIGFNLSKQLMLGPEKAITLTLARRPARGAAAAAAEAAAGGTGAAANNNSNNNNNDGNGNAAAAATTPASAPPREELAFVPHAYAVVRPNTGLSQEEIALTNLARVYDRCVGEAAARRRWTEIYDSTLEGCVSFWFFFVCAFFFCAFALFRRKHKKNNDALHLSSSPNPNPNRCTAPAARPRPRASTAASAAAPPTSACSPAAWCASGRPCRTR